MSRFELSMDIDQNIPIAYHHDTITPEYNGPNWHHNLEILYITEGEGSVLCGSAILNLMLYLAKNHSQFISGTYQKNTSNESMRLALGYMKSHFNQNLSLDKIAYESGLSKFYFSREFKKITGMTPVTYINSLRCSEAKKQNSVIQ